MVIKAVNNIASSNSLVPTLLVFEIYLRIHNIDPLVPSIIKRVAAIKKVIEEIRKIRDKN